MLITSDCVTMHYIYAAPFHAKCQFLIALHFERYA